jgi:hypothetical protein
LIEDPTQTQVGLYTCITWWLQSYDYNKRLNI